MKQGEGIQGTSNGQLDSIKYQLSSAWDIYQLELVLSYAHVESWTDAQSRRF
jgi:hypothetical protein